MRSGTSFDTRTVGMFWRIVALTLMTFSFDVASRALGQEPLETIEVTKKVDRWKLFGHISQAFAISDGHQILGITEDGSANYRTLALQARYLATPRDKFVAQVAHEKLGDSPLNDVRDDVNVDWLFYERRFSDNTLLKVGRVPMPIGIFNTIRDVGTLLPFFTPPVSMYQDGNFSNETLDGLLVTHEFDLKGGWGVEANVYWGEFELAQSLPTSRGLIAGNADARDVLGSQVWINTPLSGVRVGMGYLQHRVVNGIIQNERSDDWSSAFFSIDATFDRYYARMEMCHRDTPLSSVPDMEFDCFYVQAGVRLWENWHLNLQYDYLDLVPNRADVPIRAVEQWRDTAISLSYATRFNVVIRAEYHFNEGFFTDDLSKNIFFEEPDETEYGILSVSYSF